MRQRIADLANASPVIAAGNAIARVGAEAQDMYQRGKAKLNQVLQQVLQQTQPSQAVQRPQSMQRTQPVQKKQPVQKQVAPAMGLARRMGRRK